MKLRRHSAASSEALLLVAELDRLADSTVELANQIKATVAELRRQDDERGDGDD